MGSSRSGTGVTSYEKERIHAGVRDDIRITISEEKRKKPSGRRGGMTTVPAEKKKRKKRKPAAEQTR